MVCLQGFEVTRMDPKKDALVPPVIHMRTLLMVLLGIMAVEVPLRMVPWHETVSPLVLLGVCRWVEGSLIIGLVFIGEQGLSDVGLSKKTAISGLWSGLAWSGVFGGTAFLISGSLLAMGVDPLPFITAPLPKRAGSLILFFLVGGIISPVTEELLFRGVLYGYLRRWGMMMAIVLSTLVFVSAHMTFPQIPFNQAVGGIVFALAYEVKGNLMVPITIHAAGNLAIFSISLISG